MAAATARKSHARPRAKSARPRAKTRPPRRRSGAAPKAPRGVTVTRSGTVALPRTGVVTRPRKPAASPRARTAPRRAPGRVTPVLDRVLRGPGYIALVGVLLAGIVFFNVDVLQVNHGIAATGARADALKRQNAVLTRELAKLASTERIQEAAAAQGLVLPPPGDVRYLKARGDDSRRALRTMTAPEPTTITTPPVPQPAAPEPAVVAPVATEPQTTAPPATTPTTTPATTAPQQTPTTTAPQQTQTPPAAAAGGGVQATG